MEGSGAAFESDYETARRVFAEALRIFHAAGDLSAITLLLSDFALVSMHDGDVARAVRLTGASDALQERSGADLARTTIAFVQAQEMGVEYPTDADRERHQSEYAAGRLMDTDAAVAYALERPGG